MAEFYLNRSNATKLEEDLRMHESIVKLDEAEFGGTIFDFPYFAREAMQRYKHSNPDLFKLILKMTNDDDDCTSLATQLIMDALNLSAKKLHIEISYVASKPYVLPEKMFFCGSWREVTTQKGKMLVLPGQVFESASLKELTVIYCIINQPISDGVTCLNLVSLNFTSVTIGDDALRDILSKCPLLEYLDLFECKAVLTKISLGKMQRNLNHCRVTHIEGGCVVDFFEQGFTQYPNLISLAFNDLNLEKTFFHDSMVKFPGLTELSLGNIYGLEDIVEISLPCLKYLTVERLADARWVFNAPCIRKFHCWGYSDIPPLYISTSSNEWVSADIELDCYKDLPRSWFLGLQEFLQNLTVSKKISLSLSLDYGRRDQKCIDKLTEEDILGVPCTHVENLIFQRLLACNNLSLLAFSNLVGGLLSTCRPNFITVHEITYHPQRQPSERDLPVLELLRKSVTDHTVWKDDLKQVTYKMLSENEDETLREWSPILWDELIASVSLKIHGIQIRLKLEWHGELN